MRDSVSFIIIGLLIILLFLACMTTGAVEIPFGEIVAYMFGKTPENDIYKTILFEARMPMAVTAMFCGMALSISGLMLQTTFNNPLAGPSILGVSTGASLGVALIMLGPANWMHITSGAASQISVLIGAIAGAGAIILILISFSSAVRSPAMLLIAGIMIGYLASAVVSWLNFFAPAQEVKGYAVWGMGSFMGVTNKQLPLFVSITTILCAAGLCMAKPLNALLAGDRYAASLGYNPRHTRTRILFFSGALTAIATAYCGPVGFLGLAVPHIARVVFRTSHHSILLSATLMTGAGTGLLCAWLCVLPGDKGVLPLSAVTPIVGIPVILYVIIRRKRLFYFN